MVVARTAATVRRSGGPLNPELAAVQAPNGCAASVMIEKFAIVGGKGSSEFLDLNHTSCSS
jgi:hypothetical protein